MFRKYVSRVQRRCVVTCDHGYGGGGGGGGDGAAQCGEYEDAYSFAENTSRMRRVCELSPERVLKTSGIADLASARYAAN